jgi:DNA repair exonuclease SbcCD ATPase subunit
MQNLKEEYRSLFAEKLMLFKSREIKYSELKGIYTQIEMYVDAREILIEASKVIQRQFKARIESLITYAIQSIYNRPLSFELQFQHKRNNIEAIPIVKENGEELKPNDNDLGGGILDVISFGFRIVLWYLEDPRSRNILFLDEPFRYLGNLVPKAGQMLKYLSKKFILQIILVTHDKHLIKCCDRVYKIRHDGTESIVTRQLKRRI